MDAIEKLMQRARTKPGGLSFRDFETLMEGKGWSFKRQKGSHRLWFSPKGYRLPVQPKGRGAKSYQVKQFLAQQQKEDSNGQEKA